MIRFVKIIILLFLLTALTTFAVTNNQPVMLNYYFHILDYEAPLYAVIYIPAIMGLIIGFLLGAGGNMKLRGALKRLRKENERLQKTISEQKEELPAP